MTPAGGSRGALTQALCRRRRRLQVAPRPGGGASDGIRRLLQLDGQRLRAQLRQPLGALQQPGCWLLLRGQLQRRLCCGARETSRLLGPKNQDRHCARRGARERGTCPDRRRVRQGQPTRAALQGGC